MPALVKRWREALSGLRIRHPDERRTVLIELVEDAVPKLRFHVLRTPCTVTGEVHEDFEVSTVALACWPGLELARQWVAAAWAGYIQHEALELCDVDGERPLDPHARGEFNRGLMVGLPLVLTRETLRESLVAVMPRSSAAALMIAFEGE